MSAVRTKVAWSQRVCTWACGQREGGAVSREGGGHVYSEVNQSALCLTHFLTPVTVSSRALPCHMLTNSALNTITATMGLCYSEKKRKFGVLKSWGEVSFCLSASFFFFFVEFWSQSGFALWFNPEATDSSVSYIRDWLSFFCIRY